MTTCFKQIFGAAQKLRSWRYLRWETRVRSLKRGPRPVQEVHPVQPGHLSWTWLKFWKTGENCAHLKTGEKCAHLKVSHLASSDVRALEVGVEEDVEVERGFLGMWSDLAFVREESSKIYLRWVVDAYVQMQLFFSQDDSVGDAELMLEMQCWLQSH